MFNDRHKAVVCYLKLTGTNPQTDQVMEIGLCHFDGTTPGPQKSWRIRPTNKIPQEVDAELADRPTFAEVAGEVVRFGWAHGELGQPMLTVVYDEPDDLGVSMLKRQFAEVGLLWEPEVFDISHAISWHLRGLESEIVPGLPASLAARRWSLRSIAGHFFIQPEATAAKKARCIAHVLFDMQNDGLIPRICELAKADARDFARISKAERAAWSHYFYLRPDSMQTGPLPAPLHLRVGFGQPCGQPVNEASSRYFATILAGGYLADASDCVRDWFSTRAMGSLVDATAHPIYGMVREVVERMEVDWLAAQTAQLDAFPRSDSSPAGELFEGVRFCGEMGGGEKNTLLLLGSSILEGTCAWLFKVGLPLIGGQGFEVTRLVNGHGLIEVSVPEEPRLSHEQLQVLANKLLGAANAELPMLESREWAMAAKQEAPGVVQVMPLRVKMRQLLDSNKGWNYCLGVPTGAPQPVITLDMIRTRAEELAGSIEQATVVLSRVPMVAMEAWLIAAGWTQRWFELDGVATIVWKCPLRPGFGVRHDQVLQASGFMQIAESHGLTAEKLLGEVNQRGFGVQHDQTTSKRIEGETLIDEPGPLGYAGGQLAATTAAAGEKKASYLIEVRGGQWRLSLDVQEVLSGSLGECPEPANPHVVLAFVIGDLHCRQGYRLHALACASATTKVHFLDDSAPATGGSIPVMPDVVAAVEALRQAEFRKAADYGSPEVRCWICDDATYFAWREGRCLTHTKVTFPRPGLVDNRPDGSPILRLEDVPPSCREIFGLGGERALRLLGGWRLHPLLVRFGTTHFSTGVVDHLCTCGALENWRPAPLHNTGCRALICTDEYPHVADPCPICEATPEEFKAYLSSSVVTDAQMRAAGSLLHDLSVPLHHKIEELRAADKAVPIELRRRHGRLQHWVNIFKELTSAAPTSRIGQIVRPREPGPVDIAELIRGIPQEQRRSAIAEIEVVLQAEEALAAKVVIPETESATASAGSPAPAPDPRTPRQKAGEQAMKAMQEIDALRARGEEVPAELLERYDRLGGLMDSLAMVEIHACVASRQLDAAMPALDPDALAKDPPIAKHECQWCRDTPVVPSESGHNNPST